MRTTTFSSIDHVPAPVRDFPKRRAAEIPASARSPAWPALGLALLTWSVADPSLNHATNARVHNLLGAPGAIAADMVMQILGLGWRRSRPARFLGLASFHRAPARAAAAEDRPLVVGVVATSALAFAPSDAWKLAAADRSRRRCRRRGAWGLRVSSFPSPHGRRSRWASALAASPSSTAAAASLGGPPLAPGDGAAQNPAGRARAEAHARFDDEEAGMSRASASCRSAPSSMPFSPPRGHCAKSRVAARGRRASPRPSSALGLRPPQPARRGQISVMSTTP